LTETSDWYLSCSGYVESAGVFCLVYLNVNVSFILDGRIILMWIFRKWYGEHGLD
jgi:hypothetical protein